MTKGDSAGTRRLVRLNKAVVGKVSKHYDEILSEVRQLIEDAPVSREYLIDLAPIVRG